MAQAMPRQQLVLLGASAGWMLPTAWLAQFEEVHAWDIDPLAAPLFRWRHGRHLQNQGTRLHLHTGDGLALLAECTRAMPGAFFWFDNLLGQLRFTREPLDAVSRRLQMLPQTLQHVAWGSVHDRMSGPTLETIAEGSALPVRHPDWHDQHWLTQLNAQSPWLDHLTHSVFPADVSVQDFAWNFSPRYRHWLQAAWVRP